MKTVLLMHYGGDIVRGSEVCLFRTIQSLIDYGYKVVLLRNNPVMDKSLPCYGDDQRLVILDFSYPEIMFDKGNRSFPIIRYLSALRKLSRIIKQWSPQFLLCNSGMPCQLAVPAARLSHLKVGCHFHHPAPKRYLYLWLLPLVDYVFCPSKYTSRIVADKCGKESDVVYNTVDFNRYKSSKKFSNRTELFSKHNIPKDSIVFSQVAALVPIKRPIWLLEAFAEVKKEIPNAHLIFIGKGPELEALRLTAERLLLTGSVTLTGFVDSIVPYLESAIDINILASEEEGLGISVIEASSFEIPSIATDCTGLSEVIEHERTGLKFDINDKSALISHMVALAKDYEVRVEMGKQAREWSERVFSVENYDQGIKKVADLLSMSVEV
ncbi:glycosyltransferase family 4 protein [Reinekea sp. G2M2-21]|uniref:glycosyltransferase family 4 protein n=1 Tax=Reinekea sp. G2M2-21 TaxID=2788942 RepID=UPI0018A92481|nr:glycosyltransferase family 4 protein [Reinekea sp. G2M2-21]